MRRAVNLPTQPDGMLPTGLFDICPCLPQAVLQVDRAAHVVWMDPGLTRKSGVVLRIGQPLLEVLEPGPERDRVGEAIHRGQGYDGVAVTCALHQVGIQVRRCSGDEERIWVLLRPSGADDEVAFSKALQEIACAVGESLDLEAVCAAAVSATVRHAQLRRAGVYLAEEGGLRRVATSDVAGGADVPELDAPMQRTLAQAVESGEPRLGIARGGAWGDAIFAAVPLSAQGRTRGALLLCKPEGARFSVREMDLWSAAAAQLAVAVENAGLLRQTQAALRSRDEFMSIASHELRTPLAPLKMSLGMIERKLEDGAPVELPLVARAKRQVDRISGLIRELLEASRAELGKLSISPAPLDLAQLVVELVAEFRAAYPRELSCEVPNERLWVKADRDRLEQVIINLIENAFKYSPKDRPVSVVLERGRAEARLRVADRGIGIPVPEQSHVFDRFYRAQNAAARQSGLGLGLYISHSVVRLHGGRMEVRSAEDQGSTFTVTLPVISSRLVRRLPRFALICEPDAALRARVDAVLGDLGIRPLDGIPETLRNVSREPLELVFIGGSSPRARRLCEALRATPWARPVPVVWCGPVPPWAGEVLSACERPFRDVDLKRLLGRVLANEKTAGAGGRRSRARSRLPGGGRPRKLVRLPAG